MRVIRRVVLALALAACGEEPRPSAATEPTSTSERRPNVVLVMIDTLRSDHLACYGQPEEDAPFLSELALRSAIFRGACSTSSWTAPATASLFTSLHPTQHGVLEGFYVHRTRSAREVAAGRGTISLNRLPESVRTLPEHFAAAGWTAFAVTCNINVTAHIGFERGFRRFRDLTGPEHGKGAPANVVTQQLREWKDELAASRPYLLYLHLNDVHSPWRRRLEVDPAADELTVARAGYRGELRFVDAALRRMYREHGWDRDTLLCIVSDHGEEFGEHGRTGHGASLHGELTRVVMILSWPERWRSAKLIDAPASLVDVYPTLAELVGAPVAVGFEGRSLVPWIEGAAPLEERPLFSHRRDTASGQELWAVVLGSWKLIQTGERVELYDLARDPGEHDDAAWREPERVAALRRTLDEFRSRARPIGTSTVEVELDEAQLEALRQLGYADDGH